jgi:D-amino-acid oxidase
MEILIIGAGVSGLTTAISLKEKYPDSQICIAADKFGEDTTSTIAGALWEWQPAVCGFYETTGLDPLLIEGINKRDNTWAFASYNEFYKLKGLLNTGVYWRRVNFYLTEDTALENNKIKELATKVYGFDNDSEQIFKRNEICQKTSGFVGAYSYLTPMIDMSLYINWLTNKFLNNGGNIIRDSFESIQQAKEKYAPDVIINCAGLGSRDLVDDTQCIPVKGGWLLYDNLNQEGQLLVKEAHCTTIQENKEGGNFIFTVPRGADKLVVGGFALANDTDTDLSLDHALFKRITEQNSQFLPWLQGAKPINHRVGLRPFRKQGVRVEKDDTFHVPVIHNYGHGGSGVTLSWGCAMEVTSLLA